MGRDRDDIIVSKPLLQALAGNKAGDTLLQSYRATALGKYFTK